jgi:chromosome segregation ATPase
MADKVNDLYARLVERPSYMELESALLEGAAAIHSLTAERNQLRSRLQSREQEITHLRAANDDLRRHIAMIGESYMRFATSCVAQLQYVGQAMQEMEQANEDASTRRA